MRFLQAAMALGLVMMASRAEEVAKPFEWNPPKVTRSMFTPELGMLDAERDEYATNLANNAVNLVISSKASATSLEEARKMLALALHLSPRNKRAIVVNFQLQKGILPELVDGNYSPQVFARLLLTRGGLLEEQGGTENKLLARMFIQLAATMDPKNEDAVYASEVHRLDHGAVDWSVVVAPENSTSESQRPVKKPVAP